MLFSTLVVEMGLKRALILRRVLCMDQVVFYNKALNQVYVANSAIYLYIGNCYRGTV